MEGSRSRYSHPTSTDPGADHTSRQSDCARHPNTCSSYTGPSVQVIEVISRLHPSCILTLFLAHSPTPCAGPACPFPVALHASDPLFLTSSFIELSHGRRWGRVTLTGDTHTGTSVPAPTACLESSTSYSPRSGILKKEATFFDECTNPNVYEG